MKVFDMKSIMTMIFIILLITISLVFYPVEHIGAESESKDRIAYVDLWAVFDAHPEKAIAESELNQLAQTMQVELEEEAKGLPNDEQQDLLKEYQGRLTQREQELIQNIIDSIKDIVIQIAEEKEVRMVLEKTNVIYGGYDLTEDVINFIEENNKREETENDDSPVLEESGLSGGETEGDSSLSVDESDSSTDNE